MSKCKQHWECSDKTLGSFENFRFEEELEDPEDRLMYVGSVMKVGQLSEEAGRKMVFFYTNNFRDEYRVQLKDKREGVRKEIDLFFKVIFRHLSSFKTSFVG